MQIEAMGLGPLGTNCYILHQEGEALIVDPGGEAEKVISFLDEQELTPLAILLTHAHFDHIGGVDSIRRHYGIDVYLHEAENDWLADPALNRSVIYFGEAGAIRTNAPEKNVTVGTLDIGSFHMDVIHTPGHSPGSVTYIFHEHQFIVSGDVVFHNGMGRTDLPGGNIDVLIESIQTLYELPDDYAVYAGHNIPTTIGQEKHHNPYTAYYLK